MKVFKSINKNIISAHKKNDGKHLAILYKQYGLSELKRNNIDSGCFFLTQAYIFALEEGKDCATKIHSLVKSYGRES